MVCDGVYASALPVKHVVRPRLSSEISNCNRYVLYNHDNIAKRHVRLLQLTSTNSPGLRVWQHTVPSGILVTVPYVDSVVPYACSLNRGGMKRSTLGTTASLEEAIRVGEAVFREALEKSATCPKAAEVPRAPTTLADALAAAQNRDEEKRKRELLKKDVKTKGKQATPLALAAEQGAPTPGLSIGNVNDASAFWMYAEVWQTSIRSMLQ